jgi:hypothetical protein
VQHSVRVTPDGTTLAFESERSLTGYDNEPAEPVDCTQNQEEGERPPVSAGNPAVPCHEVYVYDAVTEKLVCASCDPSGARPVGPADLGGRERDAATQLGVSPFYPPRNLSESGGRLFFQSRDPLVLHDTDEQLNVYEWEQPASPAEAAAGENSCTQAGGCTLPISDVAGDYKSHFMDASPSGKDAFIVTADQLVPSDTDTREDVYDVRVGGGFPVTPAATVCNTEAACKSPVSPQPGVFAPPASATFSGPGNITPAVAPPPPAVVKPKAKVVKCKRGYVKKKVKKKEECIKRKKSKKTAAKKSAKGRK